MSVGERVRQEIREIGLVTLYFLTCFLFFLTLKKLVLDEYDVEISVLGTAAIGAVVAAKVVILLGKTPLGNFFVSDRRVIHVLWRSIVYTAIVFVVTLAERVFDLYREKDTLAVALRETWSGETTDHFLAMNLAVAASLVAYNAFAEIDHQMGEGALRRLFLGRRTDSPDRG